MKKFVILSILLVASFAFANDDTSAVRKYSGYAMPQNTEWYLDQLYDWHFGDCNGEVYIQLQLDKNNEGHASIHSHCFSVPFPVAPQKTALPGPLQLVGADESSMKYQVLVLRQEIETEMKVAVLFDKKVIGVGTLYAVNVLRGSYYPQGKNLEK